MLDINMSITALFLSWNEIRGEGISLIAKGLVLNSYIKVIDISFNPIGSMHTQRVNGVKELAKAFMENESIVHIDLSYIGLNDEDCDELNKGLHRNRTILGIHMLGNSKGLDARGFCTANVDPPSASHLTRKLAADLKPGEIDIKDLDLQKCTN